MITIFKQDGAWKGGKIFINMENTSMGLPKLDTVEEQHNKRFERSKEDLLLLLEKLSDEEYTLNYYGDYLGSEQLFEAEKHLTSAYHLTRKYLVSKGEIL